MITMGQHVYTKIHILNLNLIELLSRGYQRYQMTKLKITTIKNLKSHKRFER